MKEFYERIEDQGVETICRRLAPSRRDDLLAETADDDLVYYFIIGLTANEFKTLWSPSILEEMFWRLSPTDLLTSFHYLSYSDLPALFSPAFIRGRLEEFSDSELVRCMAEHADSIQTLLRPQAIRATARRLTLTQIGQLCRLRPKYAPVFQPVFGMAFHCIFPVKEGSTFRGGNSSSLRLAAQRVSCSDLRGHIMSFLVEK
jgi:hypothetical protein